MSQSTRNAAAAIDTADALDAYYSARDAYLVALDTADDAALDAALVDRVAANAALDAAYAAADAALAAYGAALDTEKQL